MSSKLQPTPGPWRVERQSEKATGWKGLSVFAGDVAVANLVMQLDDREMANAKLIAAAPDLLEAAETVLAGLLVRMDDRNTNGGRAVPVFDGIADIHRAINKAKGLIV